MTVLPLSGIGDPSAVRAAAPSGFRRVDGHTAELSSVLNGADELGVVRAIDRPRPVGPRVVDATHGIEAFDVVALDREADQSAQGSVHLRGAGRA